MADTMNTVGVYQDSADPDEGLLHASYVNIASLLLLTNQNGGSLVTADVVTIDTTNDESAVEASSSGPYQPAFVIPQDVKLDMDGITKTVADEEAGWMYKPGSYVPAAAVDGAVVRGEYLAYSSTAKKFTGTGYTACRPLNAQAIALETIATAGNIPVLLLFPSPQFCRRARVYRSTDQSSGAGASTAIAFDTEVYDNGGLHSTSSNTERFTIPAGTPTYTYDITGSVAFAAAGNNNIQIKLNGSDMLACNHDSSTALYLTVATQFQLAAGDYVELIAYTAASATIKYYDGYSPVFTITQLGE